MIHYTLICPIHEKILLIKKNKPEWQKGKLNLLGGKVEEGEEILESAQREFLEEAGANLLQPVELGKIHGRDFIVHVVGGLIDNQIIMPSVDEGEIRFYDWLEVSNSPLLIPNLRVIIPLCLTWTSGWNLFPTMPEPLATEFRLSVA